MIKIGRYILVLTGILVASIALPSLYWTIFEKVPRSPQVFYSCVTNDFIIADGSTRTDRTGKVFDENEYEQSLPFMFYRQLMSDGNMPDSINGVEMDAHAINRASAFFRYIPRKVNSPSPTLYPLIESQSGKVNLAMPDDYFRMEKSMEFIVARTNKIDEEKSELFTKALLDKGFVFPAEIIAGIPSTRKSCDEGYFVTDDNGDLFNVKMVKGQPAVVKIEMPEKLDIEYIEAVDLRSKEYYCYLFTYNQGIYLVMDETYELQRLPIDGFDPYSHTLRMVADLFNKTYTVYGDNWLSTIAVDDMYKVVNTYNEEWDGLYDTTEGKVSATLFPFEIRMSEDDSSFVNFFVRTSPGMRWIIVNIICLLAAIYIIRKKGWNLKTNIIDLVIIALTGIYGLAATQFFPNKFRKGIK